MQSPSQFGATLRTFMQQREIGLERLSQRAGVSKKTLHNWLRPGGVQRPYAWQPIIQVAQSLALSRSELSLLLDHAQQPTLEALFTQAQSDQDKTLLAPWNQRVQVALFPRPQMTIGREQEIGMINRLLQTERLVSLIGTGGSGKTYLALEVAHQQQAFVADGVWWVDLAQAHSTEDVIRTIRHTLGLPAVTSSLQKGTLYEFLHDYHALLILDNLEQVIEVAADIHELLQATDALKIITTSRIRLNIPAEQVVLIKPLAVPAESAELVAIQAAPAYQLLKYRMNAIQPLYDEADVLASLAELTRLVAGLPLAIELIGSHLYSVHPQQLCEQLRAKQTDLIGLVGHRAAIERQQSLDATIRWSYELLYPAGQQLLLRCALYPAGWQLDWVQAFGSASVKDMNVLLEHHLVQQHPEYYDRYTMLVPIREWALHELAHTDDYASACEAQADHMTRWLEDMHDQLCGHNQQAALQAYDQEHANVLIALTWTVEHAPVQALNVVGLMAAFWAVRWHREQGQRWFNLVLAHEYPDYPRLWAKALYGAGVFERLYSNFALAERYLNQAMGLWQRIEDAEECASTFIQLGILFQAQGRYAEAFTILDKALHYYRECNNMSQLSKTLSILTITALNDDQLRQARTYFAENQQLGWPEDPIGRSAMYTQLARIAHVSHDYQEATEAYIAAVTEYEKVGDIGGAASCHIMLGLVSLELEEPLAAYAYFKQSLQVVLQLQHAALLVENLCGLALLVEGLHAPQLVAWLASHIQKPDTTYNKQTPLFKRYQLLEQHSKAQLGELRWVLATAEGHTKSIQAILTQIEVLLTTIKES